jgi:hypothetical protein
VLFLTMSTTGSPGTGSSGGRAWWALATRRLDGGTQDGRPAGAATGWAWKCAARALRRAARAGSARWWAREWEEIVTAGMLWYVDCWVARPRAVSP